METKAVGLNRNDIDQSGPNNPWPHQSHQEFIKAVLLSSPSVVNVSQSSSESRHLLSLVVRPPSRHVCPDSQLVSQSLVYPSVSGQELSGFTLIKRVGARFLLLGRTCPAVLSCSYSALVEASEVCTRAGWSTDSCHSTLPLHVKEARVTNKSKC